MRSFRSAAVAILLAAGFALATAPAAKAVTYAAVSCESGGSRYMCTVYHDATEPASIRWYVNGVLTTFLNDEVWTGRRFCEAGRLYDVEARVTDASGTAASYCPFWCNPGDWP
jgi:hypothetical protein